MRYKFLPASLVTAALLIAFASSRRWPGWHATNVRLLDEFLSWSNKQNRSGAGSNAKLGLTMVPEDFAKLTLAPGFLVSLNVLDDTDMAGAFRIDQNGDINVPVLGTMHVAGGTVSQARVQIRKKLLDDQILKDPQVNLTVLEYTAPEVTIVGEVTSPGKYPLLVRAHW